MNTKLASRLRALALPLSLVTAMGSPAVAAQEDPIRPARSGTLDTALVRPSAEDRATLEAAARVLRRRGFSEESRRLRRIAAEIAAEIEAKSGTRRTQTRSGLEARATRLLRADIEDRAMRIHMLDVVAEGYEASGRRKGAEAMRWFAGVGRATESEGSTEMPRMPESLASGSGPLMQRLTKIVRGGAAVHREAGNEACAEVCERLARFYIDREAPRPDPVTGAEPTRSLRVEDLVTIEARVPVIELAARAYESLDGLPDGEELNKARGRMAWMAVTGRNRVSAKPAPLPELPDVPAGMDTFIQDIHRAGRLWLRLGDEAAARSCRTLAEYYRLRAKGEIADESRGDGARASDPAAPPMAPRASGVFGALGGIGYAEEEPAGPAGPARRRPAASEADRRRTEELRRRVIELRHQIEELRRQIEKVGRGRR